MSSAVSSAREGALAKLAQEAAKFSQPAPAAPPARPIVRPVATPDAATTPAPTPRRSAQEAAYVPVAVAPERGNTRPVVPVDGRLHMRVASATLEELDALVGEWKGADPAGLRDLERATLVRIGLGMVLADVRRHGADGAVGEAVRAALDPRVRHTDQPMPPLERWISCEER